MLNDVHITTLTDQLIGTVDFQGRLAAFHWDAQRLSNAWPIRRALVYANMSGSVEQYADRVHRWGFGGQAVRASVRDDVTFVPALRTLCDTWSRSPQPWDDPKAMAALIALLDIRYFGIARVSKLVCFLNQDRYAIYDSRVSYALKELTLDGVHRVFPFVAGKQVAAARYVSADGVTSSAHRVVSAYVNFLRLLRNTATKLNAAGGITDPQLRAIVGHAWTPALLEMALFMAGQQRIRTSDIRRLDRGVTPAWRQDSPVLDEPVSTSPVSLEGRPLQHRLEDAIASQPLEG